MSHYFPTSVGANGGALVTDRDKLHPMRNALPEPSELANFRALFVEYAKAMLELMNKRVVDKKRSRLRF